MRSIPSYNNNRYRFASTTLILLSLSNILEQRSSEAFVSPTTPLRQRKACCTIDPTPLVPQTSPSIRRSSRRNGWSTSLHQADGDDINNGSTLIAVQTDAVPETDADTDDGTNEPSKLRRLKDRMWVREALEDITAAEFACSLATSDTNNSPHQTTSTTLAAVRNGKKMKRAVDFENLLGELDRRVEEMCVRTTYVEACVDDLACYPLDHAVMSDVSPDPKEECWTLREGMGMGSVTYTFEQRDALIARILEARQSLLITMEGNVQQPSSNGDLDEIREQLNPDGTTTTDEQQSQQQLLSGEPFLYVRDDGSVDWDGALQDRAALKKIGASVWARINGVEPESVDSDSDSPTPDGASHSSTPVTAKIMETDAIRAKKKVLDEVSAQYDEADATHMALLSSAVDAGSAVAEVNLATVDPALRAKIRRSSDALEVKRYEMSFSTLNYELERIYTYLDTDLGNISAKGYIPLSDRLNVAEFGLLESQIENLNGQMAGGELVDTEVLSVVLDQTNDFKRRLGIDYSVSGFTLDREGVNTWLNDIVEKGKKGLVFYGKGIRLLSDDLVFSSSLIGRALTKGYTLKPREVRTLRRTFKDVITCVPVVIILIIPLTPVGHVLVFGAIQRFFPDFFPSCFTERRQNLLSLYETAEFKGITIDENWREKIYRALAAIGYTVGDTFIRKNDIDETGQETTES